MDQPSLNFFSDFLTSSALLAYTVACDNIIMHCAKKYLLSPPNLTPGNFSGCLVVFVWCETVNNHYLVTCSALFIVCSLPHLSFSFVSSFVWCSLIQKLFTALDHTHWLHLCFSSSTFPEVKEWDYMQRLIQHGWGFVKIKHENRL